ncbi:MAG: hypothetical protein DLM60_20080 [Pseudonocardiales bacterium]|nr:hypothetical protein [Actinomycetota bacterium]PZS13870.1 MAG: hypothetical protein DLM60_20080 [Pseudonocardiales bacterium]
MVVLPHAQTQPPNTRVHSRRTARTNGKNQDGSSRTLGDGVTRGLAASTPWRDAELVMTVARHSLEGWFVAGHEDPSSPALMRAYDTQAALHEAARAIAVVIETFRAETTALITSPAPGTGIPVPRR